MAPGMVGVVGVAPSMVDVALGMGYSCSWAKYGWHTDQVQMCYVHCI